MSEEEFDGDGPLSDLAEEDGDNAENLVDCDGGGGDQNDSSGEEDSDADLPLPTCPLCLYDEVLPECASCVPSDNSYMRRIMAIELHHSGLVPNDVVYTNIARHYNKHIHKPRVRAGMESERWTLPMVREHFENHVGLVPRRVLSKEIQNCQSMLESVTREITSQRLAASTAVAEAVANGEPPGSMEFIDAKSVKKWCDLQGKLLPLVEKFRLFQKEDALAVGLSTLWRSVSLGETSTQDAARLLESAAALQTAAGSGDMPRASELFN